jgi:hypothetical protein
VHGVDVVVDRGEFRGRVAHAGHACACVGGGADETRHSNGSSATFATL